MGVGRMEEEALREDADAVENATDLGITPSVWPAQLFYDGRQMYLTAATPGHAVYQADGAVLIVRAI